MDIRNRIAPLFAPLLDLFRNNGTETEHAEIRRWQLLQVETAIACNLRCIMCPWREMASKSAGNGLMQPDVWHAIRPHLPQIESIDFTGGGEPLLQPHLADWIREATAAGCKTGVLTNGLLLNQKKSCQLMEAGLSWICVSMDGATREVYEQTRIGADFDRVCRNLSLFCDRRIDSTPYVMINFVLMPHNIHQATDIVHLAHRFGVDQVNFKQCDVVRGNSGKGLGLFANKESKETARHIKTLAKARRLAKRYKIRTLAFAFTPDEQPVCAQEPERSMFIRSDGGAAPCINLAYGGPSTFLGKEVCLPTVLYGRLPQRGLPELWDSETCRTVRIAFEDRNRVFNTVVNRGNLEPSLPKLKELLEAATQAMPAPPEGCAHCHYLFNI